MARDLLPGPFIVSRIDRGMQRVTMPALLLENIGVDRAVRLGDPRVWRGAIQKLTR